MTAIGIISLDNYDDIIDRMDDKYVSALNTLITTMISDWANDNHIFYKRINSERYFFVAKEADVDRMKEHQFVLLKQVKEAEINSEFVLTLSMGIAYGDAEIEKMYKLITEDLCIPCVRLYIGGLVEASAYENECDKNVTSNCADVIITNTMGNLSMFYLQATMFAYLIMAANEKYGLRSTISTVTTPPSTIDTDQINQSATVMETPQESVTIAENSDIVIEIDDNATKNTTVQKTETIVVDDKGTSTSTSVSSAEDDGDVSFLADLSNPGTSATI